jgi:beta-lactamase regulating signal transducer with metallopeptidase domain/vancomycin resistance protein YoaR
MQKAPIELTQSEPVIEAASDTYMPAAIAKNDLHFPTQIAQTDSAQNNSPMIAPIQPAAPLSALDIAAIIWLAGMAVFAGVMLTGNALFLRRVQRNRDYNTPEFITLLNECKQTLHLDKYIRVIRASETGTAAVYGIFRPILLISPSSFEALSKAQQRHVLLHELSHIRRRDTLICAGATLLNIIHWFNPLVWIVFALMRRDIEVQCDAHVFRGLPSAERADYAGTLLKLAGPVQVPRLAPALFISKANIKRRIIMVVKQSKRSVLYTAMTLLLTMVVAVTGCTTAVDKTEEAPSPEPTQAVQAKAEEDIVIPEDYSIIGSSWLEYSESKDEGHVANIEKAVALLNGATIGYGAENPFSLADKLGTVTAENGWQTAPSSYIVTTSIGVSMFLTSSSSIASFDESELIVGGGINIVTDAIRFAADDAGLAASQTDDSDPFNIIIENDACKSGVILKLKTNKNMIFAEFYADKESAEVSSVEPDLMSSFTIDNSKHDNANRMENIRIAAGMINGIVIKPGETISLNEILGPRNSMTAETVGWKEAAGIDGGAFTMQFGGGLCAVSSALYNAAIRAELEIVDATHSTIPSDYIDGGLDAAISTPSPNLIIKNPYDTDVTIEATLDDVLLTVEVYGPSMAYIVDFRSEEVDKDEETPENVYCYNTDTAPDGTRIAPGESYAYSLSRARRTYNVYKTRYDLDGNEIDTVLYEKAVFRPIQGVIYVNGPDPNEPAS